jgi:hypothetical protein
MRTKTIIDGFKNSQKFRFILQSEDGAEVGMVITIQQMSDNFATRNARVAIWDALARLSYDRRQAEMGGQPKPLGLVRDAKNYGFRQVQVDLH